MTDTIEAQEDRRVRSGHIKILRLIFEKDPKFISSGLDAKNISKLIELGCNNAAIREAQTKYVSPINWVNKDFCVIYSAIFYKVVENIDPQSSVGSRYLINRIIKEQIPLKKIAFMESTELCPEKNDTILKVKNARMNEKIKHKTTKRFACPNCKKRRAQYKYVQLRSFDEGYNTSLTCIECGQKWVI